MTINEITSEQPSQYNITHQLRPKKTARQDTLHLTQLHVSSEGASECPSVGFI